MVSRDSPDPIAGWFQRNRTRLAWATWLLLAAGGIPDLMEGTVDGYADFAYRAVFFGLLSWSWGSRQDRTRARYWLRLATAWSVFLLVQLGLTVLGLARGAGISIPWLVGVSIVWLLAIGSWLPYRRIRQGGTWPPEGDEASTA